MGVVRGDNRVGMVEIRVVMESKMVLVVLLWMRRNGGLEVELDLRTNKVDFVREV